MENNEKIIFKNIAFGSNNGIQSIYTFLLSFVMKLDLLTVLKCSHLSFSNITLTNNNSSKKLVDMMDNQFFLIKNFMIFNNFVGCINFSLI